MAINTYAITQRHEILKELYTVRAAMEMAIDAGFRIGTTKRYRVFYEHGAYEWYVNTGRAPLWHYRKYGVLVGAYNARAGAWANIR